LDQNLSSIFGSDDANAWMKGMLSSEQIIAAMDIHLDRRFRDDFLSRRLYVDCARMKVNVALFEVLRKVKTVALIVIATDNMDCFADTFGRVHGRRHRAGADATTLAQWARVCDDIICSSNVAALKADDAVSFFGPWLSQYGMTFADALLIDDRADNCAAFQEQGGTALRWKMGTNDIAEVAGGLGGWLQEAPVDHPESVAAQPSTSASPHRHILGR
jgi:hypothetical protein